MKTELLKFQIKCFHLLRLPSIITDLYRMSFSSFSFHFLIYVSQIIILYTLNFVSSRGQLYFIETGKKNAKKEKKKSKHLSLPLK